MSMRFPINPIVLVCVGANVLLFFGLWALLGGAGDASTLWLPSSFAAGFLGLIASVIIGFSSNKPSQAKRKDGAA